MLSPAIELAVRRALRAEAVDESYVAFVVRHLHEPDASWRWCCGSSCDPCVQRLGRVVDLARIQLAEASSASEGLPATDAGA